MTFIDDDYETVRGFRDSQKKEDLELKKLLETGRAKNTQYIFVSPRN